MAVEALPLLFSSRSWMFAGSLFAGSLFASVLIGCGEPAPGGPLVQGGGGTTTQVGAGGSVGSGGAAAGSASGGTGSDPSADGVFAPATDLVASLNIGWNLGNSLDAPDGETSWNNPTVTPELLQAVKAAGFDVVRIPVTWSMHTGAAPDYAIDATFMARVEEVVSYATSAGLYAIINVHHDGADGYSGVEWLTLNDASGQVTDANNQAVADRFEKVWQQIAARFANHDGHLLFESMNEIHDGYGAPITAYYSIVNNLNQLFVDTVRASGGNNVERNLVVPGYNTNLAYTVAGFVKPDDSTDNHLILSVHYYDPYTFALEANTKVWGEANAGSDGWGQESYVQSELDKLKTTFIDAGLPVIFGEYGATNVGVDYEKYRRYYMEYVTTAARQRGIVPIYWDNGGLDANAESFGLFSRADNSVVFPTILEAMMRAATDGYTVEQIAKP